jgi:nucleotide-binding universal stress UspA family protein
MSYRTIVVHLDTSRHAHPRLEIAIRLARQFDAHLIGLFAVFSPDPRSLYIMSGTADYYVTHTALRHEQRGAIERLFHAELKRAEVAGEWIAADDTAAHAVPVRARCADLIIAGQYDPHDPESYVGDHFTESLVMSSGRPVMLVPYANGFATTGARVVIGWDGSREATRAVHDALPFLRTASTTTVVTVNGAFGEAGPRIPGADIATLIARHGVNVEVKEVYAGVSASVDEALSSEVASLGADLLVMGAYGHARWQELVMGGVTRSILHTMTVPVLMSH